MFEPSNLTINDSKQIGTSVRMPRQNTLKRATANANRNTQTYTTNIERDWFWDVYISRSYKKCQLGWLFDFTARTILILRHYN